MKRIAWICKKCEYCGGLACHYYYDQPDSYEENHFNPPRKCIEDGRVKPTWEREEI